jgi:hypothetical protein
MTKLFYLGVLKKRHKKQRGDNCAQGQFKRHSRDAATTADDLAA